MCLICNIFTHFIGVNTAAATSPEIHFFTIEHSAMMLVAIILITIGRVVSKKAKTDAGKFKRLFWYNLIALLIIFAAIPWPFAHIARPWF